LIDPDPLIDDDPPKRCRMMLVMYSRDPMLGGLARGVPFWSGEVAEM
jgi:hypothetical protein